MQQLPIKPTEYEDTEEFATADELRTLFVQQMDNFHLLAFLLTADNERAQQCIVDAIVECGNGHQVSRRWARLWARRTIVKNAIRIAARHPNGNSRLSGSEVDFESQKKQETDPTILQVLQLEDFERFVTVMSVLEGYTDDDCSTLLGCFKENLEQARERALQSISAQELGR
jgi:hypothetical protein